MIELMQIFEPHLKLQHNQKVLCRQKTSASTGNNEMEKTQDYSQTHKLERKWGKLGTFPVLTVVLTVDKR